MLLLQATIHPDMGEKILMSFQMSATVTWGRSRGSICGPTRRKDTPCGPSQLSGSPQVVQKRSHSAGR